MAMHIIILMKVYKNAVIDWGVVVLLDFFLSRDPCKSIIEGKQRYV